MQLYLFRYKISNIECLMVILINYIIQYVLWFYPLLYLIQVLDSNGQQSKTIVWSVQLPQHMKNGGSVQLPL